MKKGRKSKKPYKSRKQHKKKKRTKSPSPKSVRRPNKRILEAIVAFIENPSRTTVERHPGLLKESAIKWLSHLQSTAEFHGQLSVAENFRKRLDLLKLCRSIGVQRAFEQLGNLTNELSVKLREASSLSESLTKASTQVDIAERCADTVALWKEILGDPDWPGIPEDTRSKALCDAGGTFLISFRIKNDKSALDLALDTLEKGLESTKKGQDRRFNLLSNLAAALWGRFRLSNQIADLSMATRYCQEILEDIPFNHGDYQDLISNATVITSYIYETTGSLAHLDRTISRLESALESHGKQLKSYGLLVNLGNLLCRRYEATGSLSDLDKAIGHLEEAYQLASTEDSEKQGPMGSLASALCDRFDRLNRIPDIDRAISLYREAIEMTAKSSANRFSQLSNLANSLISRYEMQKDIGDLNESVELIEAALEAAPTEGPDYFKLLINKNRILVQKYRASKNRKVLNEAVQCADAALRSVSEGSPWRPIVLLSYSESLRNRYDASNEPEDLSRARTLFREAFQDRATYNHLAVARNVAIWELQRQEWDRVIEVGKMGASAIKTLLNAHAARQHKETWLRDAQGITAALAYAQAKVGDYEAAVENLESGQARLLSEVLQRDRFELEQLQPTTHSSLWQRHQHITSQIRSTLTRSDQNAETLQEALESLEIDLDLLREEIRKIPGYENFQRPTSFAQLREAAEEVPLVYIATTAAGTLALVVTKTGCSPKWLETLTTQSLKNLLKGERDHCGMGYFRAYLSWRENPSDQIAFSDWRKAINSTTRWFYENLMEGILDALEDAPAATVIPCGLLALLPLHAAWKDDPGAVDGRHYALDKCQLRFAPNGRSIVQSLRRRMDSVSEHLLAVKNPGHDSARPLPWVDFEIESVCSNFGPESRSLLEGAAADRESVLNGFSKSSIFHFSGHAKSFPLRPLEGRLLLARGSVLTVRDLLEHEPNRVQFAILSACETSLPGIELPDEAVGLPSAIIGIGTSRVVASLWSVSDVSTALLITRFYEFWRKESLPPAEGLRSAQVWLRQASYEELIEWCDRQHEHLASADLLRQIPKSARPFADPFYWAAFTFHGV